MIIGRGIAMLLTRFWPSLGSAEEKVKLVFMSYSIGARTDAAFRAMLFKNEMSQTAKILQWKSTILE